MLDLYAFSLKCAETFTDGHEPYVRLRWRGVGVKAPSVVGPRVKVGEWIPTINDDGTEGESETFSHRTADEIHADIQAAIQREDHRAGVAWAECVIPDQTGTVLFSSERVPLSGKGSKADEEIELTAAQTIHKGYSETLKYGLSGWDRLVTVWDENKALVRENERLKTQLEHRESTRVAEIEGLVKIEQARALAALAERLSPGVAVALGRYVDAVWHGKPTDATEADADKAIDTLLSVLTAHPELITMGRIMKLAPLYMVCPQTVKDDLRALWSQFNA